MTVTDTKTGSAIRKLLASRVVVRDGPRTRRVPLLAAILASQGQRALEGSDSAAQTMLKFGSAYGLFDQTEQIGKFDLTQLTDDELMTLERLHTKCDYRRTRTLRVRPWPK